MVYNEFKSPSVKLVQRFKAGEMIALISELTELELLNAPEEVQNTLKEIPKEHLELYKLTQEAAQPC